MLVGVGAGKDGSMMIAGVASVSGGGIGSPSIGSTAVGVICIVSGWSGTTIDVGASILDAQDVSMSEIRMNRRRVPDRVCSVRVPGILASCARIAL